jgi:hypothetical protein
MKGALKEMKEEVQKEERKKRATYWPKNSSTCACCEYGY